MSIREDRLRSELNAMRKFRSEVVSWDTVGSDEIPDIYQFHYNLKSIVDFDSNKDPVFHTGFDVEVRFPLDYPRGKPEVRIIGQPQPIHPNIWRDGRFCMDGTQAWIPGIGTPLDSLCLMVGEIIAFQQVNLGSPANADPTLTAWIKKNLIFETHTTVSNPVDSSQIRLPDIEDIVAVKWGEESPDKKSRIRFG